MRRRQSPGRRLATVARWPLGVIFTAWRYLWRTTPIDRGEEAGELRADSPPALPQRPETEDLQLTDDGAGPMFHRTFSVTITDAELDAHGLMSRIQADPNLVAPGGFTHFGKVSGDDEKMREGDEFIIRMPGPWDGPVRVLEAEPTMFRLVTLRGHLEAGQIRFRAWDEAGRLHFQIDTWARSGDRLSNLLYHHLRFSKEVQLYMWTSVLERAAKLSNGRRAEALQAWTRRLDAKTTGQVAEQQASERDAILGP